MFSNTDELKQAARDGDWETVNALYKKTPDENKINAVSRICDVLMEVINKQFEFKKPANLKMPQYYCLLPVEYLSRAFAHLEVGGNNSAMQSELRKRLEAKPEYANNKEEQTLFKITVASAKNISSMMKENNCDYDKAINSIYEIEKEKKATSGPNK